MFPEAISGHIQTFSFPPTKFVGSGFKYMVVGIVTIVICQQVPVRLRMVQALCARHVPDLPW